MANTFGEISSPKYSCRYLKRIGKRINKANATKKEQLIRQKGLDTCWDNTKAGNFVFHTCCAEGVPVLNSTCHRSPYRSCAPINRCIRMDNRICRSQHEETEYQVVREALDDYESES